MKGKLSRMWRSGLSLMLVFCMLVSMAPAAFASESKEIKYVSLGDSMTNGYGLTGYDQPYKVNGFLDEVPEAYPYQLETELGFNLIAQLATSAMRAEDLNYILRYPNAQYDHYTYDEFIDGRWDDYKDYPSNVVHPGGVAAVAETFQDNVMKADVISFCVGNANFGVFLLGRMTNLLGVMDGNPEEDAWINFEDSLNRLDATQKKIVMEAYNKSMTLLKEQVPAGELIDGLGNVMGFTISSYLFNVEAALDRINELNPNADIILVNLMNTFNGVNLDFEYEGKEYSVPMSLILAPLVEGANAYLATLPTVKQAAGEWTGNTFYYAEAKNVSMIVDTYKDEIIKTDNVIRDRFIEEVCEDTVFPKVGGMFNGLVGDCGLSLDETLTRADVEEYERFAAAWAEYEFNNSSEPTTTLSNNKILSAGIYLAFEKAVLEAADMKSLDATAFLSLAGDLNSVFSGLGGALLPSEDDEDTTGKLDMDAIADAVKNHVLYAAVVGANEYKNGLSDDQKKIMFDDIVTVATTKAGPKLAPVAAHYAMVESIVDPNTITVDGVITWAMDKYSDVVSKYTAIYTAAGIIDPLANALVSDTTIKSLLNLFGRMLIGNGIGCHPSAAGHDTLTAAIVNAYGKHTVQDEVKENVQIALDEITKLLEQYGPEILQGAYDYADEQGYIEQLETAIETLKTELEAKTEEYINNAKPEIEAQIKALEEELATLEAELKELYLELSEKKAELEAAVGEGAEDLEDTIAQIEAAIAQIEKTIVTVEENINDIKGMIEGLQEDLAALGSELSDLGEAVVALEDAVEVLVNAIANSDGTIKAAVEAYEAARDAALAAVETVESIYKNIEEVVTEISTAAAEIVAGVEEVYNFVATELNALLESLPEDVKAQIEAAAAEIQAKAEEEIAKLNEELQKQIEALEAELAAKAEELKAAAKAEADKLWAAANEEITKIEAEIAAKKAELESAIGAQKAELEAQIKALEEQLAAKKAEIESQIAELDKQIADLYAQLENASEELKAEIESQIAALEAQKAELQAQLESVTAQIQAEIEKKIAELEALGAEIKAQIAELEAKIEEIKAATEQAAAELMAKAEEEIAKLNEELQAKVEELKAEVAAKIEEIKAAAEEQIEKLGTEISEEIAELIDAVVSGSQEAIEEAIANVETAVENAAQEAFVAAVEQIESLVDFAEEKVNEIVDAFEDAYVGATTDDYEIDENSYYVALGDGSAVSESYVDGVAAELNVPFKNLSKNGQTIEQAPEYIVANAAEIQKADLITVGYGNNAFAQKAVDRAYKALMGKPVETYDWSNFVGEEGAAYVAQALEDIKAELAAQGMNVTIPGYKTDMASAATLAVEAYAYATVEYLYNMPTVIGTIREINPDAVVIIVGMYNPLADATLKFENVSIEIGDYLDYLLEGADVYGTGFCMLYPNAIYVSAPEAQTDASAKEHELLAFLTEYMVEGGVMMNPNEDGHTYIQNQILKALNVTVVEEEEPTEPTGMKGDVNLDGKVTAADIAVLRNYLLERTELSDQALYNAEVSYDGNVTAADIAVIRNYLLERIDTL